MVQEAHSAHSTSRHTYILFITTMGETSKEAAQIPKGDRLRFPAEEQSHK